MSKRFNRVIRILRNRIQVEKDYNKHTTFKTTDDFIKELEEAMKILKDSSHVK